MGGMRYRMEPTSAKNFFPGAMVLILDTMGSCMSASLIKPITDLRIRISEVMTTLMLQ